MKILATCAVGIAGIAGMIMAHQAQSAKPKSAPNSQTNSAGQHALDLVKEGRCNEASPLLKRAISREKLLVHCG